MKSSPILLVIASALAACTYAPQAAADPFGDVDASGQPDIDAPVTTTIPCSAPDATGLVLCLELDDGVTDGTLTDSSPGHHDAASSGLVPVMRTLPGMSPAGKIGANAVTRVPETPALDRDSGYTFAVWIRPDSLPDLGVVYGILDHEGQYAMLIGHTATDTIENRCVHTGVARYEWTEGLTANAWSFLACTWDGAQLCSYRWSSPTSHEHFCHAPTIFPTATGSNGLAIGHLSEVGAAHSRLDGALDSVQIYDHGLTENQLCTLVGQGTGCMPIQSALGP